MHNNDASYARSMALSQVGALQSRGFFVGHESALTKALALIENIDAETTPQQFGSRVLVIFPNTVIPLTHQVTYIDIRTRAQPANALGYHASPPLDLRFMGSLPKGLLADEVLELPHGQPYLIFNAPPDQDEHQTDVQADQDVRGLSVAEGISMTTHFPELVEGRSMWIIMTED